MNCEEFRNRLASLIERRQPLDTAAAEAHLRGCDNVTCRREWEEALLLERGIAVWRRTTPWIDVTERVVAAWRVTPEQSLRPSPTATSGIHATSTSANPRVSVRGGSSSGAWSAIAVAAVLCVGTVALLMSTPQNPARSAHPELASTQRGAPGATVPLPAELVAQSEPALQDMGRSYVGLMQNATFAVTDVVVLTLGADTQLEEPSPAARWVHHWRDELDPVTDDVDDAVQKFLKTFPDSFPST